MNFRNLHNFLLPWHICNGFTNIFRIISDSAIIFALTNIILETQKERSLLYLPIFCFTIFLYFYSNIPVFFFYHFLSIEKISFSHSFEVSVLVTNSLCFFVLIFPLFLKDIFTEYRIPCWPLFCFFQLLKNIVLNPFGLHVLFMLSTRRAMSPVPTFLNWALVPYFLMSLDIFTWMSHEHIKHISLLFYTPHTLTSVFYFLGKNIFCGKEFFLINSVLLARDSPSVFLSQIFPSQRARICLYN